MRMNRAFLLMSLSAVVFASGACGRNDRPVTDSATGTVDSPAPIRVAEVTVGKGLDANKKVMNTTDNFAGTDTIYASVRTTGSGTATRLTARWMFEDSTMVQEQEQTISPTGEAWTEFHITKATPWPKGKYTLRVLLNGQEVETESFTVR
jgi:hypothetical protein